MLRFLSVKSQYVLNKDVNNKCFTFINFHKKEKKIVVLTVILEISQWPFFQYLAPPGGLIPCWALFKPYLINQPNLIKSMESYNENTKKPANFALYP